MERPRIECHRVVQEEHRLDNLIGQGREEITRPVCAVHFHTAIDAYIDLTDSAIAWNDAKSDRAHARAQLLGHHAELDCILRLDIQVLAYDRHDIARAAVPAHPLAVIVELHLLGYGMLFASFLLYGIKIFRHQSQ